MPENIWIPEDEKEEEGELDSRVVAVQIRESFK